MVQWLGLGVVVMFTACGGSAGDSTPMSSGTSGASGRGGSNSMPVECAAPQKVCSGICASPSPDNGCGQTDCSPCPVVRNGKSTCENGACALQCGPDYANCDGDESNGCELSVVKDVMNCGACGLVCQVDHAKTYCGESECKLEACDDGWFDNDGVYENGCESDSFAPADPKPYLTTTDGSRCPPHPPEDASPCNLEVQNIPCDYAHDMTECQCRAECHGVLEVGKAPYWIVTCEKCPTP